VARQHGAQQLHAAGRLSLDAHRAPQRHLTAKDLKDIIHIRVRIRVRVYIRVLP
jgi:hypothetical protein